MKPKQHTSSQSIFIIAFAIIGLIIVADLFAVYFLTDFWSHPFRLQNKFGLMAAEVINVVGAGLVLFLPVFLLYRVLGLAWLKILAFLVGLPLVLLHAAGWSFYSAFQKFIGVYVIQTVVQDGDQLLKFVALMPSAINLPLIVATVVLVASYIVISFGSHKLIRYLRATMAVSAVAVTLAAVPISLIWNAPPTTSFGGNGTLDTRMSRILSTEYELLSNKSGPFTSFVSNLNNYVMQERNFASLEIEKQHLLPRSGDISGNLVSVADKGAVQGADQYSIVFFLVESLRPDMIAAYGGDPQVMPTVNSLAENALIFSDVWTQSSHSNYADVSALSGQYPLRSANIHFYPENPPYPRSMPYDILKPAGYHTGFFSSQNEHWGQMSNYVNTTGLDRFSHVGEEKLSSEVGLSTKNIGIEVKTNEESGQYLLEFNDFMYRSSGTEIQRLDGLTTAVGLAWLDTFSEKDDFFLYFNYQASHSPYNVLPDNFERKFLLEDSEEAEAVRQGETIGVHLRYIKSSYQDSLFYVDQNIREVVDHMKSTGRHDKTIYVISADTSMELSTKLVGNGGDLVPDVLKVPLIISSTMFDDSTTYDIRAEQIDIMPTVLALSGHAPHPASQGINLLEHDPNLERAVYAVAQTPIAHQYSIAYGDWQLTHDFESGNNVLRYLGEGEVSIEDLDTKDKQWLAEKLQTWINTQLAYYANSALHEQFFPPQFSNEQNMALSAEKRLATDQ